MVTAVFVEFVHCLVSWTEHMQTEHVSVLFLSFRRVLNVNYFFLGNSPASEF